MPTSSSHELPQQEPLPNFVDSLLYLHTLERTPFENTPRFVRRCIQPLFYALTSDPFLNDDYRKMTPTEQHDFKAQRFEEIAQEAIERSNKDYVIAFVGQQATRAVEGPIIFPGIKTNAKKPYNYEELETGIGGYILGIPQPKDRFNLLIGLSSDFYKYVDESLKMNTQLLGGNINVDSVIDRLTGDSDRPNAQLHGLLDTLFGNFIVELQGLKDGFEECKTFSKQRMSMVQKRSDEYKFEYKKDPSTYTVLQTYSRYKYEGPRPDQWINVHLTSEKQSWMKLLSLSGILGNPLPRAAIDIMRERGIVPLKETYKHPESIIGNNIKEEVARLKG